MKLKLISEIRGYVICGEGRVGSNLLCEVAIATGKLGVPKEYFNENYMKATEDPNYPQSTEAQLDRILSEGMTSNGVYGTKLFAPHFDQIGDRDWMSRLPNLKFIYIQRRDLLMRAISFERAEQTGLWSSSSEKKSKAIYNGTGIREHIENCAMADYRWQKFFARNGIEPLWLVYEEFTKDLCKNAISEIAKLCEVELLPDDNPAPKMKLQRDKISYEWRARYIKENSNRTYLDTHELVSEVRVLKYIFSKMSRVRKIVKKLTGKTEDV